MPTRTMLSSAFTAAFYARAQKETAGRSRPSDPSRSCWLSYGQALVHDPRREEHQELRLARGVRLVAEQEPDIGQVPEEGHARIVDAFRLAVDAADDDRATVLDQDLGLDVLGGDRDARRGRRPRLVLVHIDRHDDVAVRRDLRLHLERKVGLAERDRG